MGSIKGQCSNCQKQFSCSQERGDCEGFVRDEEDFDVVALFLNQDSGDCEELRF